MKRKYLLFIPTIILLVCMGILVYFACVKKENETNSCVESGQSYEVMDWQHNYYILLQEFMAGGFPINWYSYYPDGDKDKFSFALLDMNNDDTPELLLKYDNYWTVFRNGNTYEDAYVGEIMYYNEDTGYAFCESYFASEGISAYRFNGSELVLDYRSKREQEVDNTQHLADRIRINGKCLSVENIHSELCVEPGMFREEVAMRGYNSLLYYRKNHTGDYPNAKYALINFDSETPVLACTNDGTIQFCFYSDGRLVQLEQGGYGIEEREYSYYPYKSMVRESQSELGYHKEMFFYLKDGAMQEVFSTVQEPIYAWGSQNSYKKDLFGNVKYNYYINQQIVSKRRFEKQRNAFMKEYNLGDEAVSLKKDVYFEDYVDMKVRLEDIIRAYCDGGNSSFFKRRVEE